MTADEYEVSFQDDENVWNWKIAQFCEYTKTTEWYTLKGWIL